MDFILFYFLLHVADTTFYSLLLPLLWAAVLRQPSTSDPSSASRVGRPSVSPSASHSVSLSVSLCGSELLTQSGWWMELQYLFPRLFIKLQFHSTVPASLQPPSLPWATPPGHSPACRTHFFPLVFLCLLVNNGNLAKVLTCWILLYLSLFVNNFVSTLCYSIRFVYVITLMHMKTSFSITSFSSVYKHKNDNWESLKNKQIISNVLLAGLSGHLYFMGY